MPLRRKQFELCKLPEPARRPDGRQSHSGSPVVRFRGSNACCVQRALASNLSDMSIPELLGEVKKYQGRCK